MKEVKTGGNALSATFTSLRTSPTAREKVRAEIEGNETSFRAAVNEFLEQARQAIVRYSVPSGQRPYADFVLILDGMDRLLQVEGRTAGGESHKALFIDGFDDLTSLDVSVVYTAPLSLVRAEGNTLANLYARDPYVLPMVKTEHRGREHPAYEPGRQRLEVVLQRRIPDGVALVNVITDEALAELIYYSGGHIRSLLRLCVRHRCKRTTACPFRSNLPAKLSPGTSVC